MGRPRVVALLGRGGEDLGDPAENEVLHTFIPAVESTVDFSVEVRNLFCMCHV
jgi:hypothetical protein